MQVFLTASRRRVQFETYPTGANVFVNGFEKVETPTQLKVRVDDRIDFRLDGYTDRVFRKSILF